MRTRKTFVDFEIKSAGEEDGERYFEGYASGTKNIDNHGEIVAPGAFAADLPKFLDDGFVGGMNHDWNSPIGKPVEASEDERGLYCKAILVDTEHAEECYKLLKAKICRKLSIGFLTVAKTYLETPTEVETWWKSVGYTPTEEDVLRAKYGAVVLNRVRLLEFSPVMRPANTNCDVTTVKGAPPRAGVPLPDHLDAVRALVDEACDRVSQVARKRAEEGRGIAPERLIALRTMRDRLDEAIKACGRKADPAEVLRLRADLLRLEAGIA